MGRRRIGYAVLSVAEHRSSFEARESAVHGPRSLRTEGSTNPVGNFSDTFPRNPHEFPLGIAADRRGLKQERGSLPPFMQKARA